MKRDYSWERSANKYYVLYQDLVLGGWQQLILLVWD